jgi:hypothetical protein
MQEWSTLDAQELSAPKSASTSQRAAGGAAMLAERVIDATSPP